MAADLELLVFHRGMSRVVVLPSSGVVGVGRDPGQVVRIDDPRVSRGHARLTVGDGRVVVQDEGSANGTEVLRGSTGASGDAQRTGVPFAVKQPTEVKVGDSIFVGSAVLILRESRSTGASPMAALDRLVTQIAPGRIRVLCVGETGVGKELLAERIHRQSSRATGPMIRVHCGGLSETLLESELFGHERGAFTGAFKARVGLIEAAHGGTLFLDEVGEMSGAVQVKLLRVLEDGRVQRVGSNEARPVDVRVVSATHRDLAREVKEGRFRQDLYFRLNGITLRIPPLRERRDEIVPIAVELIERAARQASVAPPTLDDEARARLLAHAWPGNVRELRQVMERALALAGGGPVLGAEHVVLDEAPASSSAGGSPSLLAAESLKASLEAMERTRIEDALVACGGNQSRAAKLLGMPRRTLVERLSAWGKTRPRAKHP